jgi:PKHD-type hydroxylase
MLLHIPSLFAADELLRIREALAQADWADGKVTAGHQSAKAKHNLQLPEAHPLAKEIGSALIERLWQTPQFMSAALPHKVFPPLINCYREGGNFGFHIDNASPRAAPSECAPTCQRRCFSVTRTAMTAANW